MGLRLLFAAALLLAAPDVASARRERAEAGETQTRVRREKKKSKRQKKVARRRADRATDDAIAAHLREVTAVKPQAPSPPPAPPPAARIKPGRRARLESIEDRIRRVGAEIPDGE